MPHLSESLFLILGRLGDKKILFLLIFPSFRSFVFAEAIFRISKFWPEGVLANFKTIGLPHGVALILDAP
jgi:hypothetical protein